MVALVALAGLGGFTALSVQGGVQAQSAARFNSVALYAAESGAASTMEFLRNNIDPVSNWTAFVHQNNVGAVPEPLVPGSLVVPDALNKTENLHHDASLPQIDQYPGWFKVTILNNESDPGFGLTASPGVILDTDARLRLRVVGYGPNGASVTLEIDVTANNADALTGLPCSYEAQQGLGAQNAGVGCITQDIDTAAGLKDFNAPPP